MSKVRSQRLPQIKGASARRDCPNALTIPAGVVVKPPYDLYMNTYTGEGSLHRAYAPCPPSQPSSGAPKTRWRHSSSRRAPHVLSPKPGGSSKSTQPNPPHRLKPLRGSYEVPEEYFADALRFTQSLEESQRTVIKFEEGHDRLQLLREFRSGVRAVTAAIRQLALVAQQTGTQCKEAGFLLQNVQESHIEGLERRTAESLEADEQQACGTKVQQKMLFSEEGECRVLRAHSGMRVRLPSIKKRESAAYVWCGVKQQEMLPCEGTFEEEEELASLTEESPSAPGEDLVDITTCDEVGVSGSTKPGAVTSGTSPTQTNEVQYVLAELSDCDEDRSVPPALSEVRKAEVARFVENIMRGTERLLASRRPSDTPPSSLPPSCGAAASAMGEASGPPLERTDSSMEHPEEGTAAPGKGIDDDGNPAMNLEELRFLRRKEAVALVCAALTSSFRETSECQRVKGSVLTVAEPDGAKCIATTSASPFSVDDTELRQRRAEAASAMVGSAISRICTPYTSHRADA